MRKPLLVLALLLLAGGAIAWQLQQGEGYILIAMGAWTIEMSLWVGVLLLALTWIAWSVLKALLIRLFGPERGLLPVWRHTRQRRVRQRRELGLRELLEGRWSRAQKILERTGRKSDEPMLDWLAASSAALERGNFKQARALIANAAAREPEGFGVRLQESRVLLAEHRYGEALPLLESLHNREPVHQEVLRLLTLSHRTLGNWLALEKLLPELKRHQILVLDEYQQLQQLVYRNLLEQVFFTASEKDLVPAKDRVLSIWERVPTVLRRNHELVATLIRQLHAIGEGRLAETQLNQALKRQWSEELVELYGVIEHRDLAASLASAEKWLPLHPSNPTLLLTLGRLCVRAELWGKAKDYLEAAIGADANSTVYAELAALSAHLGETDRSAEYYRLGLEARGREPSLGLSNGASGTPALSSEVTVAGATRAGALPS